MPTTPTIVVSPRILGSSLALASAGQSSTSYLALFAESADQWNLSGLPDWLSSSLPERLGPSSALWSLQFSKNSGTIRTATLTLSAPNDGSAFAVNIDQPGGDWVEWQASMILLEPLPPPDTARLKFPLAMELGAAGKYIAETLKKLPPPARAIGFAGVSAAIAASAGGAIALRKAFAVVPEPPDYFQELPLVPMTDLLIVQQATAMIAYIFTQLGS